MKPSILSKLFSLAVACISFASSPAQSGSKVSDFRLESNDPVVARNSNATTLSKETIASSPANLLTAKSALKASKENLKANKALSRATQDFQKTYEFAPEPKWVRENNALFASFVENGVTTRVAYDKAGCWVSTIRYLPASRIPADVRADIKRTFPRDQPLRGFHLINRDMEYYIVHTVAKDVIKELAVYNNEAFVIKKYVMSK